MLVNRQFRPLRGRLRIGFICLGFGFYESPHAEVKQGWTATPPVAHYDIHPLFLMMVANYSHTPLTWLFASSGANTAGRHTVSAVMCSSISKEIPMYAAAISAVMHNIRPMAFSFRFIVFRFKRMHTVV